MKLILSPARGFRRGISVLVPTEQPIFTEDTSVLFKKLKNYAPWDLENILKINHKIALSAFDDIHSISTDEVAIPALFAYDGLVYKYLDPFNMNEAAIVHSQSTIRIISAFYGLLRPLDVIQPYRLEMQSNLRINGKNLYDFWNDKLHRSLYYDDDCVINLASEEYAKIIRKHLKPNNIFIDIVFYSTVKGKRKIVTTTAKMARGLMARYILENGVDNPEDLKTFDLAGLAFAKNLSSHNRYVFFTP